MHTPGSVHSLLFHPLPLEFLAPICSTLFIEWVWWDQNNLITHRHNRILFMQYTLKWKTNKETKFKLFVNCSSLVPDTTINRSVHQFFEEKVSLNFIYRFQSPETITIAPLYHYSEVPRGFFYFSPKSSNTSQHIQHQKLLWMKSKVSFVWLLVLWMHCSSKKTLLVLLFCASYSCRCSLTAQ